MIIDKDGVLLDCNANGGCDPKNCPNALEGLCIGDNVNDATDSGIADTQHTGRKIIKSTGTMFERHTHENNTVIWDSNGCVANFEGRNHIKNSADFLKAVNNYDKLAEQLRFATDLIQSAVVLGMLDNTHREIARHHIDANRELLTQLKEEK
ncbi:MAG: hypothetical protein WC479_10080 [Candidatus Izemoplasmatales bacterium]